MPKDTKLFTVSISNEKHPKIKEALDKTNNAAHYIREALLCYLDKNHNKKLSSKDYCLLKTLQDFGLWDILLTLSEKGMLSSNDIFFDNMLKAISFSQSVFQKSHSDDYKNPNHLQEKPPASIFSQGKK